MGCEAHFEPVLADNSVSIHAPVWGANYSSRCLIKYFGFNPRTRVGCEQYFIICVIDTVFQSTHPCGVRIRNQGQILPVLVSIHAPVWGATICMVFVHMGLCFNPRTRVGCEPLAVLCMQFWGVSIHAPVWGANGRIGLIQLKIYVSIHAPVWGATMVT